MKRFIIKLRVGAQRATLVTHDYDREARRTRTVYLGSVDLRLDPALVRIGKAGGGLHIKPDASAQGRPFEIDSETCDGIADWLEVYGTFRQLEHQAELARARQIQAERDSRLRLAAEVRESVEADVRAELAAKLEAQRQPPIEAAIAAVKAAGAALVVEAQRLRLEGCRLTNIRAQSVSGADGTPLDVLQAAANQLRTASVAEFEEACKAAGLMARRGQPRARSASR